MGSQLILFTIISLSSSISIFNGLAEIKKRNEINEIKKDIKEIKRIVKNKEN